MVKLHYLTSFPKSKPNCESPFFSVLYTSLVAFYNEETKHNSFQNFNRHNFAGFPPCDGHVEVKTKNFPL